MARYGRGGKARYRGIGHIAFLFFSGTWQKRNVGYDLHVGILIQPLKRLRGVLDRTGFIPSRHTITSTNQVLLQSCSKAVHGYCASCSCVHVHVRLFASYLINIIHYSPRLRFALGFLSSVYSR